ncbi:peptidoglycan-associated lipoprotein Pal [Erythrobacter litoralis]|uniref:Peptidoglycan-associated lipoprotein n=1 Tax=Erythrobacter litoralis (strain HTCC2594) TaxID=314225 RepID=Q2NCJ7_ERYLH|nr:peptidoglycan-associated lipoprotein Pal [Erythrobacter litoralis]ABC62594.1 peptidoglycan-associated protein [Erythrobacter litoralis HTCC2594]
MKLTHVSPFALAALLALSACGKKDIEELPIPGDAPPASTGQTSGIAPGSQADFMQQMGGKEIIYFDTDRFNIDDIDAAALQQQAQWLSQYPGKRATIEGHADERGTREYNLALGERRANAAKNYLASLGIDTSRLSVISYGEERPVALGSDQAAWSQNRRAVTVTID